MRNTQFFTALCLPLIVFLIGFYFQNTGIRDLRSEMGDLRSDMNELRSGMRSEIGELRSDMNLRFARFDQRFGDLTSKVIDIDNRLIRARTTEALRNR